MANPLSKLLSSLTGGTKAQLRREVRFLKVENEILCSKIQGRVIPTPEDRARLVRFGRELGPAIDKLISIVQPETFRKWLRVSDGGNALGKKSGRPAKSKSTKELVIQMAQENPGWGYTRISGELAKVSITCCPNTVKAILVDAGIAPQPGRRRNSGSTTWNEFTRMHANSIVAADFLTKEVTTLAGKFTCYILFFIHLGSRRVHVSSATYSPDAAWMAQQARNMAVVMQDWPEADRPKYLIHDNDPKFTAQFDELMRGNGARKVKIPKESPNCNAYAEAWVASLRRECLDHFTCFGKRHLDFVLQSYVTFYNRYRPHQGRGNKPLKLLPAGQGQVKRWEFLGGLLSHYYREAG